MKKIMIIMGFILMVMASDAAAAISLTDYTPPESSSSAAYITGAFNLDSGNQPETSFNGFASGYYENKYYSIPYSWRLRFDGEIEIDKGETENSDTNDGYNFLAHADIDRYFNNTDFLYYGSIDLGYREQLNLNEADDLYSEIGAGVGYGRFYDATPLAKAMRVVDDLIDYGVITRKISDTSYRELAQLIDKEDEFESKHGSVEYKKYWFEAMETVFKKDGVLKQDTLGALGVIRIEDILEKEYFTSRTHGWKVKAGMGYIISDYNGENGDPALTASFEYGLPYFYKLQLTERFDYMYVFRDDSDDNEHDLSNRLGLTYEISNRIDWENYWLINASFPKDDSKNKEIFNSLSSIFRYYLTNKVTADARISFNHFDDEIDDNGNDDLETKVFLGFTVRAL